MIDFRIHSGTSGDNENVIADKILNIFECQKSKISERITKILMEPFVLNLKIQVFWLFVINSSKTLRHGSDFWPDDKIIRLLVEKSMKKITFGSDYHNLETIGRKYEKAISLLKSLGINELHIFKKRKPIPITITN